MRHRRLTVAITAAPLAAVAALLAGCSDAPAGEAMPTGNAGSSISTSSSSAGNNHATPFAGMQACDLLDKALQSKELPPGEPDDIGSENGCQTNKPQVVSYRLDLMAEASLKKWGNDPNNLHDGQINGRPAVQEREIKGVEGSCGIAMKVPPKSVASVGIVGPNDNTKESCNLVTKVAEKIEAMLPGGK